MFLQSLTTPHLPPIFSYPLDDGTPILVRPLQAQDAPRLREGFQRLSALARRRRFLDDMNELTDERIADVLARDPGNRSAWGAANLEKPAEPGIGIARYVRINGEPEAADVAIVIADEYQGRGAGFVLQACLHLTAHAHGIRTFYYDVHSENDRIIKHLKLLGAQHAGRADNIDRLSLPVYHRAWDVPSGNEIGQRFAEVFRRLQKVETFREAA